MAGVPGVQRHSALSFSCGSFPSLRAHGTCPPVFLICDPGPAPAPPGLPFARALGIRHRPGFQDSASAGESPGQLGCALVLPGSGLGRAGVARRGPEGGCGRHVVCISFACPRSLSSPSDSAVHPCLGLQARPGWPRRAEDRRAGERCPMEAGGITAYRSPSPP